MEQYTAKIRGIESDIFVAVLMKLFDDGGDIRTSWEINCNGIFNVNFVDFAQLSWSNFKRVFEFSIDNIELAFGIKICKFTLRNGKIYFTNEPIWGPNVVFINYYERKRQRPTVKYARLPKSLIM